MHKTHLFSDKWILIIGIPLVGIAFPIIFGTRFDDPRFFGWIAISIITTLISWLGTRYMVSLFWEKFPWEKSPLVHILMSILLIFLLSAVTSVLIYFLNSLYVKQEPGYWRWMRPVRFGILIAFTIIMIVHEAILLFFKWKNELIHSSELEKENIRSKFDALKNHVNPHFLFNSLGTLASLIRTDPEKAGKYVNEFSRIYRYFLEVNNNDLVTIGEEMNFINSYIFLQQIRYGDGFKFQNDIPKKHYQAYILPLTLELLVENALKHNTTQVSSPLIIEVKIDENQQVLIVKNTYQPREVENTLKTGLNNLEQRYLSFLKKPVRYGHDEQYFTVEIPIITNDE